MAISKGVFVKESKSQQMKITEDVRKYAAEQGIAEEEALKEGQEKSKEFVENGSEVYAKAMNVKPQTPAHYVCCVAFMATTSDDCSTSARNLLSA